MMEVQSPRSHGAIAVGPRLRELRLRRGLSLAGAAESANVSKSTLAGWEAGRRMPPGDSLASLLRAYGVEGHGRASLLAAADPRHARLALVGTPMGAPVHLGDALRAMRLRRAIGQADLARKLGVSQSTVTRWEAGDLVPAPSKLQEIYFELDARPEEIEALVHFGTIRPGDVRARVRAVYDAPFELQELLWLACEAELWWRGGSDAEAYLIRVQSRRAQWYHYACRTAEAEALGSRIVRDARPGDADHVSPAVFSLFEIRRKAGDRPLRLINALEGWRSAFRIPEVRAWAQAEIALTLAENGERKSVGLASEAVDAARDLGPEEFAYRRIDLGKVHLRLEEPERALEAVEGLASPEALVVRAQAMMDAGVAPSDSLMDQIHAVPDEGQAKIKRERRLKVERQHARLFARPDPPLAVFATC